MDLRQLAALTAVADHRSFSAAARATHTVQSNISAHVANLESELGTRLVDRSTGQLTPAGALVVARARRVHAELESLAADVTSSIQEVSGTVRLGVIGTTGRWMVPLLLPAVGTAHPRVHLIVVDATTTSLLPQLVGGELDLAVVNLPVADPEVSTSVLFDEQRIVVAPAGHALAGRGRVSLAELAEHPLLLEPAGTAFRDELDAETARADLHLSALAEVDGMRLLATLAFEGFGPAVLPASAAPRVASDDWETVLVDDLAPRSVGMAVRRHGLLSAPARAVRDVIIDIVADQGSRRTGIASRV